MFVFLSGTGTNGNLKRNLLPGVTTTSTRKVPVPVHRNRGILTSLMLKFPLILITIKECHVLALYKLSKYI